MRAFTVFFLIFTFVHSGEINKPFEYNFGQTKFQNKLHVNIEGLVQVDGKPSAALIEVNSTLKNHSIIERVYSDAATGIFRTSLRKGDEYDLVVHVNRLPQQVLQLNTKNLDSTKTINIYADFTSATYDHKLEELKKSVDEKIKNDVKPSSYEKKYGHVKKEKLIYKIQVGAFKFYENFNYSNVIDLPKIIRKTDSDYITRFTMGSYHTYSEAVKILRILQERNLKEAFIIAYYDGNRKLLAELLSEKILN